MILRSFGRRPQIDPHRPQAYVSAVETGQQRVTVVEFCEFADALGFDVRSAIRRIHEAKAK